MRGDARTMRAVETRIFLDGGLPPGDIAGSIKEWVERARNIDYDAVVFDIRNAENQDMVKKVATLLESVGKEQDGFTVASRITIMENDVKAAKQALNNVKSRFGTDIVAIRSENGQVLNFAAKDSRIQVISLDTITEMDAFSDGVASLAGQFDVLVELPFRSLLFSRGAKRSRIIRGFRKVLDTCKEKHANVVFGASAWSTTDIRHPWQKMVAIEVLLDLSRQEARRVVFKNPRVLIPS